MDLTADNSILAAGLTALGLPEAFREAKSGKQPCKAKWRSHPPFVWL